MVGSELQGGASQFYLAAPGSGARASSENYKAPGSGEEPVDLIFQLRAPEPELHEKNS